MKMFIYRGGEVQGPFSRTEVFAELCAGNVTDEDLGCQEGSKDWQPLRDLFRNKPLSVLVPDASHKVEEVVPWLTPYPQVQPILEISSGGHEASAARNKGRWMVPISLILLFCGCATISYLVGQRLILSAPRVVALKTISGQGNTQQINSSQNDKQGNALSSSDPTIHPASESDAARQPDALPLPTPTQTGQVQPPSSLASGETRLDTRAEPITIDAGTGSVKLAYIKTSFAATDKYALGTASSDFITTNLFQTPIITPEEMIHVLEQRFSTNPVNSKLEPARKSEPNVTIREGSFILETALKWNPKIEVIYSIPLTNNVTPGPHASNVVMLGFYPNAMAPPKATMVNGVEIPPGKSKLYGALGHYAREFGFTAFTMHIVTRTFNDSDETYFLGSKQWADIAFRAQDELTRMFRLPPRKLMLEGMSLGGSFVERIAAARPERVAAVALHSAPEISIPDQHSDTLWYMQITRGDSMQNAYNDLYNALIKLKDNVLFDILPPNYGGRGVGNFYHSESVIAKESADAFLEGVANRRDSVGNIDPLQWPYARRKSNPINILSRTSPDFAQMPSRDREYLPSQQFVRCLQALPVRVQSMILPTPDGHTARCFVGLPPLGQVRGVLIYTPEQNYSNITNLFDNVYYLSEKGYLVLCPYSGHAVAQAALTATMKFQQNVGALKAIPTVFVGMGDTCSHLWESVSKSEVEPKAIALIGFKPRQAFDESRLPVGTHPIRCPVFFIEEEKRMLAASTSAQAREVLNDAQSIDSYVAMCRERHQTARIVSIPDSDRSNTYNAQKSIEAVNHAFEDVVDGKRGFILK